jgi:sec-independent protein translocase protein TatB
MDLFGVGFAEAGLIFLLGLILIGPQRFPEIARQAGRWYRQAREFTDSVMTDVRAAVDEIEDEIADKNEGARPIRELQDLRREFEQIGQETAAAAGDEAAAARVASDVAEPSAEAAGDPFASSTEPVEEERPAGTGTGSA